MSVMSRRRVMPEPHAVVDKQPKQPASVPAGKYFGVVESEGLTMKSILVEKHPTEPRVYECVGGIQGEWIELVGDDKVRMTAVLDLMPSHKQFGLFHLYQLSNDEFYSVLGRLP